MIYRINCIVDLILFFFLFKIIDTHQIDDDDDRPQQILFFFYTKVDFYHNYRSISTTSAIFAFLFPFIIIYRRYDNSKCKLFNSLIHNTREIVSKIKDNNEIMFHLEQTNTLVHEQRERRKWWWKQNRSVNNKSKFLKSLQTRTCSIYWARIIIIIIIIIRKKIDQKERKKIGIHKYIVWLLLWLL